MVVYGTPYWEVEDTDKKGSSAKARVAGTHNVAISSKSNESSAKTPANAREDTPRRTATEAPRAGAPEHPNAHEDTPKQTDAAMSRTRDAPAPGPSETPSEA